MFCAVGKTCLINPSLANEMKLLMQCVYSLAVLSKWPDFQFTSCLRSVPYMGTTFLPDQGRCLRFKKLGNEEENRKTGGEKRPKYAHDSTTVNWAQLSNRRYVDTEMLPGSYPHREYIWFVCSETSYSGEERICYRCRTNNEEPITEDRATQPMEAGGWVSQMVPKKAVCRE